MTNQSEVEQAQALCPDHKIVGVWHEPTTWCNADGNEAKQDDPGARAVPGTVLVSNGLTLGRGALLEAACADLLAHYPAVVP